MVAPCMGTRESRVSPSAQTARLIGLFNATSILILACPAWVILRVTVGAVDAPVAIVNPWIHPLDPCHVPVVVLTAAPIGGLAENQIGQGSNGSFSRNKNSSWSLSGGS